MKPSATTCRTRREAAFSHRTSEVTNNETQRDDVQDAAGGGVQSSDFEVTNNETQRDDVQDAAGSGVQSSD